MRVNLLEGGITSSLTKLALPIMATSLIQMAYNLIDMIWIGRIGSGAVAAVGAAGMFMWLSNGLAILARTGGQVKVAQSLGADRRDQAISFAQSAIQMGVVFSLLYSLVLIFCTGPLIGFFNLGDAAVIRDAEVYLKIVGLGMLFGIMNPVFTGIITATGNSRTPFMVTSIGLVINIIFDPLLIFGLGPIPAMGVAGAAWATIGAQAVVTLLFVFYGRGDSHLLAGVKLFSKPNWGDVKVITRLGLPTALQNVLFSCIAMVIARLIAAWGAAAVAVQKVGSQIESISWMTADGFGAAVSSFVGQNYGAGNLERAKKGYLTALSIIAVWGVLSSCLLIFCAEPLFRIFIHDAEVIPMGVNYLRVLGFSQLLMCVDIVTCEALAGFGKTLIPSISNIVLTTARIPLAMLLSATALGLNGIWWALTLTSNVRGVLMFATFCIYMVILKKQLALADQPGRALAQTTE